ncbi:MAG: Uncharacterised protein [Bacteroidetes bacterium MED-G17]|nr:MAG: Uncharacterised protein [Bacteroidetes bacterium MED-G17]
MENKLSLLLILEATLLILGIVLPMAEITELWLFSEQFSVLSLCIVLLSQNEIILGLIVLLFGVIIPICKITARILKFDNLMKYGIHKAGMIDVFLFSFLVYSSKISDYFELQLKIGFYCLFLAVLLGIFHTIVEFQRVKKMKKET